MLFFQEFLSFDSALIGRVSELWRLSFGYEPEYTLDLFERMPVSSVILALDGEDCVGACVLLCVSGQGRGYFGYGTCTHPDHSRKDICRGLFDRIYEKCQRENARFFIHPNSKEDFLLFSALGLAPVSSYYTVGVLPDRDGGRKRVSPAEYHYMRDLYHGGFNYYPWSIEALSFMEDRGVSFFGRECELCLCCAAVRDGCILELCCPDELTGKAAAVLFGDGEGGGTVRLFSEPNHLDSIGIMSFESERAYFNLFLE